MAFVTVGEVQQWLEVTRFTVSHVDIELEDTAAEYVKSKLIDVYDTSTWADATTTPKLVRKIMSMLVAAWMYRRQYGEDGADTGYASRLESSAERLLGGLVGGSINLPDDDVLTTSQPVFWPTDAATEFARTEDPSDPDLAAPRMFSMGKVF